MKNKNEEYLIVTTAHKSMWPKNVVLFWGPNESGYTSDLTHAGRYSKEQAEGIQKMRKQDFMIPVSEAEALSIRVITPDQLASYTTKQP